MLFAPLGWCSRPTSFSQLVRFPYVLRRASQVRNPGSLKAVAVGLRAETRDISVDEARSTLRVQWLLPEKDEFAPVRFVYLSWDVAERQLLCDTNASTSTDFGSCCIDDDDCGDGHGRICDTSRNVCTMACNASSDCPNGKCLHEFVHFRRICDAEYTLDTQPFCKSFCPEMQSRRHSDGRYSLRSSVAHACGMNSATLEQLEANMEQSNCCLQAVQHECLLFHSSLEQEATAYCFFEKVEVLQASQEDTGVVPEIRTLFESY